MLYIEIMLNIEMNSWINFVIYRLQYIQFYYSFNILKTTYNP